MDLGSLNMRETRTQRSSALQDEVCSYLCFITTYGHCCDIFRLRLFPV